MLLLSPLTARAEDVKLSERVSLGAPAKPVTIELRVADHATLSLDGKSRPLPTDAVASARLTVVSVTSGASVGLLTIEGPGGSYAVLLGGKSGRDVLAAGRTDLHGDPGERRALAIELGTADGTGARTVAVGTRHEGLTLCSGRAALVDRKLVSKDTLALEVVPFRPTGAAAVEARPSEPAARPLVRALDALGSARADGLTGGVVAPHALVDGGPAAFSAEPGSFAVLRGAGGDVPIERLDVRFDSAIQRPRALWLLGEGDRVLAVTLPSEGDVASVGLDPAWPGRCLAVVFDAGKDAKKPVAIAELTAYSALDRAGGLDAVVGRLVQGGPGASEAATTLAAIGKPGARAVAARFDELSAREKRRVLPLFAKSLDDETVRARMLEALRSQDKELAEPALHVITQTGDSGKLVLRELANDITPAGDSAARTLGRDGNEVPALLTALSVPGGESRPELRRVITTLAQRKPEAVETHVQRWLTSGPPLAARAALVLSLSGVEPLASLVVAEAEQVSREAQSFDDRYRLAQAAGKGLTSPVLGAWLTAQATDAGEWMMRHAAFEALGGDREKRLEVAQRLADDAYPRVRAVVVPVLAEEATGRGKVRSLATQDVWPMVRAAAARALAPHPDSRDTLRALREDLAHEVRAAAIDGLAEQKDLASWERVRAHLSAPNEWPDVQAAVARFAAATCQQEARDDLLALVRRALRPDAAETDLPLAQEALRALLSLGGKAAVEGKQVASREGAPPSLKAVLEDPPRANCGAPHG